MTGVCAARGTKNGFGHVCDLPAGHTGQHQQKQATETGLVFRVYFDADPPPSGADWMRPTRATSVPQRRRVRR